MYGTTVQEHSYYSQDNALLDYIRFVLEYLTIIGCYISSCWRGADSVGNSHDQNRMQMQGKVNIQYNNKTIHSNSAQPGWPNG